MALNNTSRDSHSRIATTRAFADYFDNAFALPLSGADFEFALDNMDTNRPATCADQIRDIDQICALLRTPDGTGRGGRRTISMSIQHAAKWALESGAVKRALENPSALKRYPKSHSGIEADRADRTSNV